MDTAELIVATGVIIDAAPDNCRTCDLMLLAANKRASMALRQAIPVDTAAEKFGSALRDNCHGRETPDLSRSAHLPNPPTYMFCGYPGGVEKIVDEASYLLDVEQ